MRPDISLVIPAYDEAERLSVPLDRAIRYLVDEGVNAEVILVDDGSRDGTSEVAGTVFERFPEIFSTVIRYEDNRGKGYAVRTGLKNATADLAIFSDADLSTPIDEMWKLVEPIRSGEADVTFGSRAIDRTLIGAHQPWRREQGGKIMNLIIRMLSGLSFSDTQCGFKAFDMRKFRPLLDVMTIDRFGFDVEFLFVARYHGLPLREIPVRWNNVEGSKVDVIRDTRRMIAELLQIRRNARLGVYDLK